MRPFAKLSILAAVLPLVSCEAPSSGIYIGTYGDAIHYVRRDNKNGLCSGETTSEARNASWIEQGGKNSSGQRVFFAVCEEGDAGPVLDKFGTSKRKTPSEF